MTIVLRRRPPTVTQLLRLLNRVKVKCITWFPDKKQLGEWRPDETDGDIEGTIVLAVKGDAKRGMDGLVTGGLHELTHAFFQVRCSDDRVHHDKIYRWESLMFKSLTLRESMSIRIGNSYIYEVEDP